MKDEQGISKGFAYLEYDEVDDSEQAIFNMNSAEFFGRELKVEQSKRQAKTGDKPIWEGENYQKEYLGAEKDIEN